MTVKIMDQQPRDHGGNLDAAVARFGGARADWIDLSTGINPVAYPVPNLDGDVWSALPDQGAYDRLIGAARTFWSVPEDAAILAAPGCSALIAQIPTLRPAGQVQIADATYNEHRAAFLAQGWTVGAGQAEVIVHPNNPTGDFATTAPVALLTVIDESFCDVASNRSLIASASRDGVIILKSFGKFWGLAGMRLGFAIGDPALIADLKDRLGPWAVSGPALQVGAAALQDHAWAAETRTRLVADAAHLDALMAQHGAVPMGDVSLFRTYEAPDAAALQTRLAKAHIWTRVFPYAPNWIRLGLPAPDQWARLESAL
ncbi:MAG: threonine-phosphate decarboxylase [Planktomarina sp.]